MKRTPKNTKVPKVPKVPKEGCTLVFSGPTGCGKSVIMRMVQKLIAESGDLNYLPHKDSIHSHSMQVFRQEGPYKQKEEKPLKVYMHAESLKCRFFLNNINISRFIMGFGHAFDKATHNPRYRIELLFSPKEVELKSTTKKMLQEERRRKQC